MKENYLQKGFGFQLSHFIEEAGEALAAAGKTQRWGMLSVNPELPKEQRERNIDWLRRELKDVKKTIDLLDKTMQEEYGFEPL